MPFTPSISIRGHVSSSEGHQHRQSPRHSMIRLDCRFALLLCIIIYLAGIYSGSFFCGVVTLESAPTVASTPVSLMLPRIDSRTILMGGADINSTMTTTTAPISIPRLRPDQLKVPTPIIVMGLMKAGTTSIYGYFRCGLVETTRMAHYDCKPGQEPSKIGMACGKRMRRNISKYHKPAFYSMDQFQVYAELDAQELKGGMTLPQWDYLDQIYQHFPNATWILNWREPTKWLDSVNRWKDLRQRFVDNPFIPELPRGKGDDDQDMLNFYRRQAERVRDFAQNHTSLSLVELPIDSPNAGQNMEDAFGISKQCWKNRNVNNGTAIWTAN